MIYRLFLIKRFLEDIILFPFILLGKIIAFFKPLGKEYETFFFFPFYHIGGAEKVHANIAQAVGNKNCIIFFTRKSHNTLFYDLFAASGCEMRDISRYTDNKWLYFVNVIFRGLIAQYINAQKQKPIVFNGQCNFGYKISPWVNKRIPQIELIHSLCSFSYIRIPFLPFITKTVMISTIRIQEHLALYKRFQIPPFFGDRIQFIMNAIDLPKTIPQKHLGHEPLVVLYVGRGTAEKRVHLIASMAQAIKEKQNEVSFWFLGEVKDSIPTALHPYCHFLGNQSNADVIDAIYNKAHVLIVTSDTEGFPMVVMEAMAKGLAIVSTAVGELPLHVHQNINGFLIEEYKDEKTVVREGVNYILQLDADRTLLQHMANVNIAYAFQHFGMYRFKKQYTELFAQLRTSSFHE